MHWSESSIRRSNSLLSPKSTFQTELVISPWKEVGSNGKHMLFGIFMNEYRRYFRQHNDGWYLAGNVGMMAFDMSKPEFRSGKLRLEDRDRKGYGMMLRPGVRL